MPSPRIQRLNTLITESIEEPKQRTALYRCMKRGRDTRSDRLLTLPGGAGFRDEVKAIKERCIADQDELLGRFTKNAEAHGAKVFVAKDAKAAIDHVLAIAKEHGAETVSKSKSLTTEEIEINDDMEEAGLEVVETDLGELIIQLVNEKPYHLVFPSVHKMRDDVAEIFAKATGKKVEAEIDSIMPVVRDYLRPIFLNTDIGMTGANIGIAETGGIVIETNEGNGRLVSSIGKVHICIMGMEKIVDTLDDALMMVLAHPVSASGQLPTTYVTWMLGRNPLGEDGAERETHLIILDNGRTETRDDPIMKESLHCIRCGACMNVCPTYGVVGGHTFGHIYPGPIGIPWTAQVHGLENAGKFADLCVSCGLCKEICPAQIDMPMMIAEVKNRDQEENPSSLTNRVLMAAESAAVMGSAFSPLSNWSLKNPIFRWVMEKTIGIDRRRELPPFARKTLRKRWNAMPKTKGTEGSITFFHDIYVNHNAPELGERALKKLQNLGWSVDMPEQRASGYPYIGYGNLDAAREVAEYNVKQLLPAAERGEMIVTTEPTAAYCLKVSYPKLLGTDAARLVGQQTQEFFSFLVQHDKEGTTDLDGRRFGFHCSCHQRPIGMGEDTRTWLERQGATMQFIESGTCCGMAGTFGLKHGPLGYDLANAVGAPLFKAFQDAEIEAIVTDSSVCAIHLSEGTGIPLIHPLAFV